MGVLTALLMLFALSQGTGTETGWLVKQRIKQIPWVAITPEEIERGATIPPDTNVLFHLPDTFERITREVLLGQKGDLVRYWGYCLPENYDPEVVARRTGLPGILFLSEAERAVRADAEARGKPQMNVFKLPSRQDVEKTNAKPAKTAFRHQLEVFIPNLACYIMTAAPLSIGLDADGDGLNAKREKDSLTDAAEPDTDQDGLPDGIEVVFHTDPQLRDSDSDNLIDGLEDQNYNGRLDYTESNPRKTDTDGDGLCDGSCRLNLGRREYIYYGEDNNLNGQLDLHETSPIKADSNGDDVTDFQAFFNCMQGLQEFCL